MELKYVCQRCTTIIRTAIQNHRRTLTRHISSTHNALRTHIPDEQPVNKYIGKHHKRAKRVYLWGNTRTGALGRLLHLCLVELMGSCLLTFGNWHGIFELICCSNVGAPKFLTIVDILLFFTICRHIKVSRYCGHTRVSHYLQAYRSFSLFQAYQSCSLVVVPKLLTIVGVPKFLIPEKENKYPVLTQSKPYNFHWPIRASLNVNHIAAGYGFSVYGGNNRERKPTLIGCGINTDSQIGFHSANGQQQISISYIPCT